MTATIYKFSKFCSNLSFLPNNIKECPHWRLSWFQEGETPTENASMWQCCLLDSEIFRLGRKIARMFIASIGQGLSTYFNAPGSAALQTTYTSNTLKCAQTRMLCVMSWYCSKFGPAKVSHNELSTRNQGLGVLKFPASDGPAPKFETC